MKINLLISLAIISLNTFGQTKKEIVLSTSKYQGIYSFGKGATNGPVGQIMIYPDTDSTILFYVEISRGAPSYHLGSLYGRFKIKKGESIYYSKTYGELGCKWKVIIDKNLLTIKTLDNCYDCGFGANLIADNQYIRTKFAKPEYFTNGEGTKIFFSRTSPENY